MSRYLVYAWVRDDVRRCYIGQSSIGLGRPKRHEIDARRGPGNYITEALWCDGRVPELRIMEEADDPDSLDGCEWEWMAAFRAAGWEVINRLPEGVRWGTRAAQSIGGKISGARYGPANGRKAAQTLGVEGIIARGRKGGTNGGLNGSAKRRAKALGSDHYRRIGNLGMTVVANIKRECSCGRVIKGPANMARHQKATGHTGWTTVGDVHVPTRKALTSNCE